MRLLFCMCQVIFVFVSESQLINFLHMMVLQSTEVLIVRKY